jgi:hypothetical protein
MEIKYKSVSYYETPDDKKIWGRNNANGRSNFNLCQKTKVLSPFGFYFPSGGLGIDEEYEARAVRLAKKVLKDIKTGKIANRKDDPVVIQKTAEIKELMKLAGYPVED